MANIKNIIIFLGIGVILVLVYVFLIRGDAEPENLIDSSLPLGTAGDLAGPGPSDDFLFLLLNIQNIKLDDSIFADQAFLNLRDSSITLTPDGTEGRPNPFAPIGSDVIELPAAPILSTEPATTNTPPSTNTPPAPATTTNPNSAPSTNPLIL